MTIRGVLSEARRNLCTGVARAGLWAAVTLVVVGLLSLADVATVRGMEREARAYQAAAANARKLAAVGQIDGAVCDALTLSSTVQAAGAIRLIDPITVDQAPDVPLTAYEVSPGLGRVITDNDTNRLGVWVEASLADALAIGEGGVLTVSHISMPIAGVFAWPDDGRDARLSFAVLIPVAPDATFDECWLKAWPVFDANDQLLRSTAVVTSMPTPVQVTQLNKSLGVAFDANRMFLERVTSNVRWASPAAMLVIGFVSSRLRRLEYAAALHAGQARGALLLGVGVEALVWAATGACIAVVVDLIAIRIMAFVSACPVWLLSAGVAMNSFIGAIAGALLGAVVIREKDLFRYFRTR